MRFCSVSFFQVPEIKYSSPPGSTELELRVLSPDIPTEVFIDEKIISISLLLFLLSFYVNTRFRAVSPVLL